MTPHWEYNYVITISWDADHDKTVPSLPHYLQMLRSAIGASVPAVHLVAVDLLGLSRGHVALLNCCQVQQR